MSTRKQTLSPPIKLHKASGQAYVNLNGRRHYLGRYGTPEAEQRHQRIIREWEANGRQPLVDPTDLTVVELLARFWTFAEGYYRKLDGTPTTTLYNYQAALRPVKELCGTLRVEEFRPRHLKAVRQTMIEAGRCRGTVNQNVHLIRRVFRWGVAEELVSTGVCDALEKVEALKRGRSAAHDNDPIKPVPEKHIDAIRPHVSRQVWGSCNCSYIAVLAAGN